MVNRLIFLSNPVNMELMNDFQVGDHVAQVLGIRSLDLQDRLCRLERIEIVYFC